MRGSVYMQIFNPCKKCIVQACCNTSCEDYHKHESFKDLLLYIPHMIAGFFSHIISEIKWMLRGEPIFIQFLITLLLICQGFSLVLCVGLGWALVYAVFS